MWCVKLYVCFGWQCCGNGNKVDNMFSCAHKTWLTTCTLRKENQSSHHPLLLTGLIVYVSVCSLHVLSSSGRDVYAELCVLMSIILHILILLSLLPSSSPKHLHLPSSITLLSQVINVLPHTTHTPHTYTHKHTHHIHTQTHTRTHKHTHIHTQTHTPHTTYTHTHHTQHHTHHTHTHHTHTHHTQTHTTHTHKHTHKHTPHTNTHKHLCQP